VPEPLDTTRSSANVGPSLTVKAAETFTSAQHPSTEVTTLLDDDVHCRHRPM